MAKDIPYRQTGSIRISRQARSNSGHGFAAVVNAFISTSLFVGSLCCLGYLVYLLYLLVLQGLV